MRKAMAMLYLGGLTGLGYLFKKYYDETPSCDIYPNTLFYGYQFPRGDLEINESFTNNYLTKTLHKKYLGNEIVYCPKNSSSCIHGFLFPNQVSEEATQKICDIIKKEMNRKGDKTLKLEKALDVIRYKSFKTRLATMEDLSKLSMWAKQNEGMNYVAISTGDYTYRGSRLRLFAKKASN